ncbi:MAG: hypothetical protein IJJ26_08950 [Victivallales bacterium]|nr:hypothetical protein [Victivallales bacterium]
MSKKPFFAYRSFWKEFETRRRFADFGVKQFVVFAGHSTNSMGEPYCPYPPVWKWFNSYDFAPFDEQMEDNLRICPDAEILCMLDLNSPLWLARHQNVDSYSEVTQAECNEGWKKQTKNFVQALVEHAEEKYGKHIVSYILMCGKTDEWMDYSQGVESEGKRKAYLAWSEREGLPVPQDIPAWGAREHVSHVVDRLELRDPQEDREALQYWRFHSEVNVDSILEFASQVRGLVHRPFELGVFYGYILELEYATVRCGHLAYERLERSPDIDFVISPGDYHDRTMGGGSGFMTPNGTVKRYHKDCLYEIDHRTTTANMQLTPYVSMNWMDSWKSVPEDVAGLRREFCRTLFHGAHLWWFDMWGKFYTTPEHFECLAKCRELWEQYADRSFCPEAEVALIVSPEGGLYIGRNDYDHLLHEPVLKACNRLGTPYEVYSLNDLPHLPERIKLAIFVGCIQLNAKAQSEVSRFAEHHACLWDGPNGMTDGLTWTPQKLPGTTFPNYTEISPEILREAAAKAGVHLFTEKPCPVWYGRNLLSVHCAEGGPMKLSLKQPATQAVELFSGRVFPVQGLSFTYDFATPETALFRLE